MIRFSAFLVVVAVGLLVAGIVTSKLLLVYIAIGVSGVAVLALGIGAAVNWRELTRKPETAHAETVETSAQGPAPQPAAPARAPERLPSGPSLCCLRRGRNTLMTMCKCIRIQTKTKPFGRGMSMRATTPYQRQKPKSWSLGQTVRPFVRGAFGRPAASMATSLI